MTIQVHHSIAIAPTDVELPADNPNHMTVEELDALRGFIESRGFLQPVLVTPNAAANDGPCYKIIDGHHRVTAAIRLKMPEISAIVVDATEAQRIRDRIAMNHIRGELDVAAVARDFELLLQEFDDPAEIAVTGYTTEDVNAMLEAVRVPSDLENLRDDGLAAPPPDTIDTDAQTYSLSLRFESEIDRARVKEMALDNSPDGTVASGILAIAKRLMESN